MVLTDIVELLLHLILTQESVRPLQLFIDPIVHIVMANELQLVVTETLEKVFEAHGEIIFILGYFL